MPERQPLTLPVGIETFVDTLAAFTPLKQALLLGFIRYMAANASPLPSDLQSCCEIVKARSMEARRAVSELTGLSPVDVPGGQNLSPVDMPVPGGQGEAFEGNPDAGLTLRSDRAWGIDPVGAEGLAERLRRVEREKKQRHRARKLSTVDRPEDVPGGLAYTRNSEDQYKDKQPMQLASLAAHAREGEAATAVDGKRRGEALKAMRACGIAGINGADPRFLALLADGVTDDELRWRAEDAVARGKGFAYAVAALWSARQEAAEGTGASMPLGAPRLSQAEARARELAGPLAVGYRPPP